MKYLLPEVALIALLVVFTPAWAQNPAQNPANPPSNAAAAPSTASAPAASEKSAAAPSDKATAPLAPEFAEKGSANAKNWVQPKRQHHVRRYRHYPRYGYYPYYYGSPYYGYPYYGHYGRHIPSDFVASQLNAQQLGGWGWSRGPYSRNSYTSY